MFNINGYDLDIANENRTAIGAEVARHNLAREVHRPRGWFPERIDSALVRLGEWAGARQATRGAPGTNVSVARGSRPQGR